MTFVPIHKLVFRLSTRHTIPKHIRGVLLRCCWLMHDVVRRACGSVQCVLETHFLLSMWHLSTLSTLPKTRTKTASLFLAAVRCHECLSNVYWWCSERSFCVNYRLKIRFEASDIYKFEEFVCKCVLFCIKTLVSISAHFSTLPKCMLRLGFWGFWLVPDAMRFTCGSVHYFCRKKENSPNGSTPFYGDHVCWCKNSFFSMEVY